MDSNGSLRDGPYRRYRDELLRAFHTLDEVHIFTYHECLYRPFFSKYGTTTDNNDDTTKQDPRHEAAITEAITLINAFHANPNNRGKHIQIHPHYFPSFVILVGEVVYTISSHNWPLFVVDSERSHEDSSIAESGEGSNPNNSIPPSLRNGIFKQQRKDELVQTYIYRREDPVLRGIIKEDLEQFKNWIESVQDF